MMTKPFAINDSSLNDVLGTKKIQRCLSIHLDFLSGQTNWT
ncbi:hypothetical protein [Moraxella sp.]|nr:hypothetical protein [Moraxella sp.]MDO4895243.1 hypothetical protein [Moraxella sp.]